MPWLLSAMKSIRGTYYFVDGIRKMPLGSSVSREINTVIMKLQEA